MAGKDCFKIGVLASLEALNARVHEFVEACEEEERLVESAGAQHLKRLQECVPQRATPDQKKARKSPSKDVLRLNVGGDTRFVTHRSTFTCLPACRLAQVFSGEWDAALPRDAEDRIFLDFDPAQFRAVLDWMADIKKLAPEDPLPPHPVESLAEEQRWGFDVLCKYLQLPLPPALSATGSGGQATRGGVTVASLRDLSTAATLQSGKIKCDDSNILSAPLLDVLGRFMRSSERDGGKVRRLSLLYRASRDGCAAQAFHARCDQRAPTVIVARSTGGHIFGASTQQPWDSSSAYKQCEETFLFRLQAPNSTAPPSKHPVHQNFQNAVYGHPTYGPTFGGGHDLRIYEQSGTSMAQFNMGNSFNTRCATSGAQYSYLAEGQNVTLSEWEVFEVASTVCPRQIAAEFSAGICSLQEQSPSELPILESSAALWGAVAQWKDALMQRQAVLNHMQQHADADMRFFRHLSGMGAAGVGSEIVTLNVRGVLMSTFRSTLLQFPDSMLGIKFGERWEIQEDELVDGGIFFDEDPALFSVVIQFLRLNSFGDPDANAKHPKVQPHKRGGFGRLLKYLNMEGHLPVLDVDSVILSSEQEVTLRAWTETLRRRQFQLLYRGSRDGFTAQSFHQLCDNKGATVVVARSAQGYVFGGFTEQSWHGGGQYKHCQSSFLFRLPGVGGAGSRHTLYQNHGHAIYGHPSYGPTFGSNHDLHIALNGSGSATINLGGAYSPNAGGVICTLAESQTVQLADLEVFAV